MKFHNLICAIFLFSLIHIINGIIFYQGMTTACDTCDGVDTNSMRNIMCCLKFSKCCIPETFEQLDAVKERENKSKSENTSGNTSRNTSGNNEKVKIRKAKIRNSRRPKRNSTRQRRY